VMEGIALKTDRCPQHPSSGLSNSSTTGIGQFTRVSAHVGAGGGFMKRHEGPGTASLPLHYSFTTVQSGCLFKAVCWNTPTDGTDWLSCPKVRISIRTSSCVFSFFFFYSHKYVHMGSSINVGLQLLVAGMLSFHT